MSRLWPLPYSGLPALMSCLSLACLTGGILANVVNAGYTSSILLAAGIILGLLSIGKDVSVSEDGVTLRYGYPKPLIEYVVNDVVDAFDVSELGRGNLIKYFKYHLFIFNFMIALPIAYLIIKGVCPNPIYLPVLLIPVFLGVVLQVYVAFTSRSYGALIRGLMHALSVAWVAVGIVVGLTYREVYGKSLTSDPLSLTAYLAGMVLLATVTVVIMALMHKHHVVVIESSDGRFYAVGALSYEDARDLIKRVLEVIAAHAETTS